jgi:ABC-type transport system involved in multi-copper enzyme maturation permease subunit
LVERISMSSDGKCSKVVGSTTWPRRMSSSRVRKTLDRLAYASLVLDVCIAVITTLSLLGASETQYLLVPINYLLTIVVVLSVIMFVVLLLLKSQERKMPNSS